MSDTDVCPPRDDTDAMILLKNISETSKISNGEKSHTGHTEVETHLLLKKQSDS